MILGWAINSAMVLLAAATFFHNHIPVSELQQAENLLTPLLGKAASFVFAIALLFSGTASSITSGMAGESIFAGFLSNLMILKITTQGWELLYPSLPHYCLFLQIYLTSSKHVMGNYTNKLFTKYTLIFIGVIVTGLNILLLLSMFFPIGIN